MAARRRVPGRHEDLKRIYAAQLDLPEAIVAAEQMRELASEKPSALLCYERDPAGCHRTLLWRSALPDAEHRRPLRLGVRWIENVPVTGLCCRRHRSGIHFAGAHQVKNLPSAQQQIVGDDPPVAAPPHGFRTHDRDAAILCKRLN